MGGLLFCCAFKMPPAALRCENKECCSLKKKKTLLFVQLSSLPEAFQSEVLQALCYCFARKAKDQDPPLNSPTYGGRQTQSGVCVFMSNSFACRQTAGRVREKETGSLPETGVCPRKLILFTHASRFTTLHRLKTTYRNAPPHHHHLHFDNKSIVPLLLFHFSFIVSSLASHSHEPRLEKCPLCLNPAAADQESCPASRLRGLGGRRGRRG